MRDKDVDIIAVLNSDMLGAFMQLLRCSSAELA
jgi:hypothetical protein